jgi:hypothetical protein
LRDTRLVDRALALDQSEDSEDGRDHQTANRPADERPLSPRR